MCPLTTIKQAFSASGLWEKVNDAITGSAGIRAGAPSFEPSLRCLAEILHTRIQFSH
jgi:hypothetical protein